MEPNKASSFFRKRLKQAIPFWLERGFLTEQQGRQLDEFYQLDQIKAENTQLLFSVIYTVGVVLIGVGVISFVAAHWDRIDRSAKVAMIFTAMLSAHGLGFYLWFINGKFPKLGHALVLLGTLVFGANIGLMEQIFHISGSTGRMFGIWAIGAAAVAYAVRSIPNATVAVVASFLFFMGFGGFWWGPDAPVWWYPLAAGVTLIPLIYLCNSRWLLWLVMVNLAITTPIIFGEDSDFFGIFIISVALGAAYLGWGIFNKTSKRFRHFSRHCMNAGAVLILFFIYLLSFMDCAEEIQGNIGTLFTGIVIAYIGLAYLISAVVFYAMSIYLNYKNIDDILTTLLLGTGGLVAGIVGLISDEITAMILANILLIGIAASMIHASFSEEDRRKFWGGAIILGAVIIGRTLEFETGLLVKAIAFTGSGIGVIIGGVYFERYMKKRRTSHV